MQAYNGELYRQLRTRVADLHEKWPPLPVLASLLEACEVAALEVPDAPQVHACPQ